MDPDRLASLGGRSAAACLSLYRGTWAIMGVVDPAPPAKVGRHETELERYDRNLNELLGELRVALPGVQVLFAFLLVAPFNQRFGSVSHFERRLYLATLLCTLLASILLIAPTLVHRLEFRRGEKAYIVRTANWLTIAGMSVFAVALTLAVLLVTHHLFGESTSVVVTVAVTVAFGIFWFAVPLLHRRLHPHQSPSPRAPARRPGAGGRRGSQPQP